MSRWILLAALLALTACGDGQAPGSGSAELAEEASGSAGSDDRTAEEQAEDALHDLALHVGDLIVKGKVDEALVFVSSRASGVTQARLQGISKRLLDGHGTAARADGTDENWLRSDGGTGDGLGFPPAIPKAERLARLVVFVRSERGQSDLWINLVEEDGKPRVASISLGSD